MNKQGNTYTFLYSVVLVVVVAALLSIVSLSLQPRQNENRQNEKRQNILSAIHISSTAANSAELFDKYIKEQFIINSKGDRIEGKAFDVNIEKQYNLPVEKRELPVFGRQCQTEPPNTSYRFTEPVYGALSGDISPWTTTKIPFTVLSSTTREKLRGWELKLPRLNSIKNSGTNRFSPGISWLEFWS